MKDTVTIERMSLDNLPSSRIAVAATVEEMVLNIYSGAHDMALLPFPNAALHRPVSRKQFKNLSSLMDSSLREISHRHGINIHTDQASTIAPARCDFHDHIIDRLHPIIMRRVAGSFIITPEDSDAWHGKGRKTSDIEDQIIEGEIKAYIPPLNCVLAINNRQIHGQTTSVLLREDGEYVSVRIGSKRRPVPPRDDRALWAIAL